MPTIKEGEVWITRITYIDLFENEKSGTVVGSRNISKHHEWVDGEHVIVPAEEGYSVYTDTGGWQSVKASKVTNITHVVL
jgi:hypothetical protein